MTAARQEQLAAGLSAVNQRIEQACARVGRDPAEITLVVVTKTFPVDDVAQLAALGVTDVGENRDQEAKAKAAAAPPWLRWHFVGQLQTNKARSVGRYADVVHSVDRVELVQALDRGAVAAGRRLDVLLQIDLAESNGDSSPFDRPSGAGGEDQTRGVHRSRGGAPLADVPALAEQVGSTSALRLRGVMAVAPLGVDPAAAFARLRTVSDALRAQVPGADWISAGMTGDLEQAVAAGATHLRVGSAILGQRPALQ